MQATPVRFVSFVEWLVAGALIAGAVMAAGVVVREARTVRAVMPVIAGEAFSYDTPAAVPARAVSVPLLLLSGGREIRIGDSAAAVAERLDSAARLVSESLERNGVRQQLTRAYAVAGQQFVLVFESLAGTADPPRVSGIYVK